MSFEFDQSELISLDEGVEIETQDSSSIDFSFIDSQLTVPDFGLAYMRSDTSTAALDLRDNVITSINADSVSISGSDAGQCASLSGNTLASGMGSDDILLVGTLSIANTASLSTDNNSAGVNQGAATITNVAACP